MLSFSFVADSSMLYFVVLCFMILLTVMQQDKQQLSPVSHVTNYLCNILLLHASITIIFCLLFYFTQKYSLGDSPLIRFILVALGLITNLISSVYPFVTLTLIRKYYKRFTYVRGGAYRLFKHFFFTSSIIIFMSIGFALGLVYSDDPLRETVLTIVDNVIVVLGIICFIIVIPDLHIFITRVLHANAFSRKATHITLYFVLYVQLALLPLNFLFYAPVMFMFNIILVFILHVLSQKKMVSVDFLTGLNNKNELMKHLNNLFVKRSELDARLKLLFIDIDDFKKINEKFNPEVGDRTILSFTNCLKRACASSNCFLCRYGGDEFVVVIHELSDYTAKDYINKLNRLVDVVNKSPNRKFELSVSVGCAAYSHDLDSPKEFIRQADHDMFIQKKEHKQTINIINTELA